MALQDILNRTTRNISPLLQTFYDNVSNIGTQSKDLVSRIRPKEKMSHASALRSVTRPGADPTVEAMRAATPTPTPQPGELPGGTDLAMNYYQQKLPPGMTMEEAFPITADEEFMMRVAEADKLRKGLANLLLLQAFFESTGGRKTSNVFGVKPNQQSKSFETPVEALEYQLSDKMLAGGSNPNVNILQTDRPLTIEDVENLYKSYNPSGDYLDDLISVLR